MLDFEIEINVLKKKKYNIELNEIKIKISYSKQRLTHK